MIRSLTITALLCAGPAAAAEVRANAQATIVAPAMLRIAWPAALPSVTGVADGARFVGRIPSMGMAMMMPANARLVIQRQDDSGQTVTAPAVFEVENAGAERRYIVPTGYLRDPRRSLAGRI